MPISQAIKLNIEYRQVEALIPYARNPRTHNAEQIAKIAASIVEYGWTNPILVDGENGILAGHGRLAAARKLGLLDVPVIELGHLSATQKRAYVISDNRLALDAGWDEDMLALEIAELTQVGFDLALTGLDDLEIEALKNLDGDASGGEQPDAQSEDQTDGVEGPDAADDVPDAPVNPVSRAGDVWALGGHRLICGDAADAAVVAKLMSGDTAALCFTSPPYGTQRDYTNTIIDWDALMRGVFARLPMASTGQVLVNLGLIHREQEVVPYWDAWLSWMRSLGWRRFGWYVWDQGPGLPGDWSGRFAPAFEFVFHLNRKGTEVRRPNKNVPCIYAGRDTHLRGDGTSAGGMRNKDGSKTSWNHVGTLTQDTKIADAVIRIMRHKGKIGQDIDHPAVFPVALPQFVLEAYSDANDIVFEPFCGSGTTMLAAQKTARRCRSVEIAPEYVDVAVKRFQQNFPGLPVTLLATGQSFAEAETERLGLQQTTSSLETESEKLEATV
ncbi:site-specific DNA-methyltransferase [Rhodoferax antarcticus]|uniref:site-specific DNA-methyltransferase n=1 Tax=Rhodoferax antarcticus TaxID=81479 RepID=UPI002224096A|nr:site-specific DNA-methyltransferase [Rhodoferax antarcticus]MCW2311461.1 DNA modification methylase [Rhodoferax antarcticus]